MGINGQFFVSVELAYNQEIVRLNHHSRLLMDDAHEIFRDYYT